MFFFLLFLGFLPCSSGQEISAIAEVFQVEGSLDGEHFLQVTFTVPELSSLPSGCRIVLKLNGREVDSLEMAPSGKLGASVVAGRHYQTWVAIALPNKSMLLEGAPIDIDLRSAVKIGSQSHSERQYCYDNFFANCSSYDVSFLLACPLDHIRQLENFLNVLEFTVHGIHASNASAEIVIVDYNPSTTRLPAAAVLSETKLSEISERMPAVRVITVPATRHQAACNETATCTDSNISFLQHVAINIGIRRSFGKHISILSCDTIPSSAIFPAIANLPLDEKRFSWIRKVATPTVLYPTLGIVERAGLKSGWERSLRLLQRDDAPIVVFREEFPESSFVDFEVHSDACFRTAAPSPFNPRQAHPDFLIAPREALWDLHGLPENRGVAEGGPAQLLSAMCALSTLGFSEEIWQLPCAAFKQEPSNTTFHANEISRCDEISEGGTGVWNRNSGGWGMGAVALPEIVAFTGSHVVGSGQVVEQFFKTTTDNQVEDLPDIVLEKMIIPKGGEVVYEKDVLPEKYQGVEMGEKLSLSAICSQAGCSIVFDTAFSLEYHGQVVPLLFINGIMSDVGSPEVGYGAEGSFHLNSTLLTLGKNVVAVVMVDSMDFIQAYARMSFQVTDIKFFEGSTQSSFCTCKLEQSPGMRNVAEKTGFWTGELRCNAGRVSRNKDNCVVHLDYQIFTRITEPLAFELRFWPLYLEPGSHIIEYGIYNSSGDRVGEKGEINVDVIEHPDNLIDTETFALEPECSTWRNVLSTVIPSLNFNQVAWKYGIKGGCVYQSNNVDVSVAEKPLNILVLSIDAAVDLRWPWTFAWELEVILAEVKRPKVVTVDYCYPRPCNFSRLAVLNDSIVVISRHSDMHLLPDVYLEQVKRMNGHNVGLIHTHDEKPWLSDKTHKYGNYDYAFRNYFHPDFCPSKWRDPPTMNQAHWVPLGSHMYFPLSLDELPLFELKLSERVLQCFFSGTGVAHADRMEMLSVLKAEKERRGSVHYMLEGHFRFSRPHPRHCSVVLSEKGNGFSNSQHRRLSLMTGFGLCPAGHEFETYRLYDFLEAGAVPIATLQARVGDFISYAMQDAPFPRISKWADLGRTFDEIGDSAYMDELQIRVKDWWVDWKKDLARWVASIIEESFQKNST